jgi:hypothetical protein
MTAPLAKGAAANRQNERPCRIVARSFPAVTPASSDEAGSTGGFFHSFANAVERANHCLMSNDETVRCASNGPVTMVTIDRPAARNAVDPPTAAGLAAAFRQFDADHSQHVAILTGRGVSGDEAERIGLANRVSEPGQALAVSLALRSDWQLCRKRRYVATASPRSSNGRSTGSKQR